MRNLYSKKIKKQREDVSGYLCLFCQSCMFGCSDACAQNCSYYCGDCDTNCTGSLLGYGT